MIARLALALLLAGCSQAVDYEPPVAATAEPYPAELAPGGGGPAAADIAWRTFFPDPRLQALIAQALDHNRDLRAATARIEEARAQYRITRADQLPGVDLRGSARYGSGSSGGGGVGGDPVVGTPGGGVDPVTGAPGGGSTGGGSTTGGNRYQLSLNATSFELDFWGRVRSLTAAARALYLQTVEARRAFQIGLVADVAEAYLIDREYDQRARLAQATIASRETTLRLAQRLFEEGEGSRLEIVQERALLTQAASELVNLRQLALQNRNLLQLLVGRPPDQALPPPRPLGGQSIVGGIAAGLPSDLLTDRPDIRAAEQALRAATANIGAARAAFFPQITLTGSLGFASDDLDDLFATGPIWSFVPALLQPIFDAGRNRANLDLSVARRDIAVADYERTIQVAFREVADALAARRYLADQAIVQAELLAAQRERLRLADLRFRGGVTGAIDVLDARRELFTAEQALVQTQRAQLVAAVQLYAALGGGLAEQ